MKNIYSLILLCCFSGMVCAQQVEDSFPFRNMNLPMEERVKDLISSLTLEEKVQLMKHDSPAITRLGITA
ncbi:MAG: hypothetical protein K2G02_08200, partial [Phocaeicola sp.]|nr:hypothetical protein [Phocaeicola sp.]